MDVLIIGGTRFLGRHLVAAAQEAGHRVTLFNRGQSNPDLFPELEHIHGDRSSDLDRLAGRSWETIIDTCGYFPRDVRASARALRSVVQQYVFISTISVYDKLPQLGRDESAPLARLDDHEPEKITTISNETYGPLKALCEQAVREQYPDRHLVIRPGLIVGRYDPTDRFTYWPWRVAAGGTVLAPQGPDWDVQIIDAADLAAWTIHMIEQRINGTFNAVGPEQPYQFRSILEAAQRASGSDANWVWVSKDFLLAQEVQPWSDLPLWLGEDADSGFMRIDNQAARKHGLTFRPLEHTIEEALAWVQPRKDDDALRAGLSRSRESELLAAWWEAQRTGRQDV